MLYLGEPVTVVGNVDAAFRRRLQEALRQGGCVGVLPFPRDACMIWERARMGVLDGTDDRRRRVLRAVKENF